MAWLVRLNLLAAVVWDRFGVVDAALPGGPPISADWLALPA